MCMSTRIQIIMLQPLTPHFTLTLFGNPHRDTGQALSAGDNKTSQAVWDPSQETSKLRLTGLEFFGELIYKASLSIRLLAQSIRPAQFHMRRNCCIKHRKLRVNCLVLCQAVVTSILLCTRCLAPCYITHFVKTRRQDKTGMLYLIPITISINQLCMLPHMLDRSGVEIVVSNHDQQEPSGRGHDWIDHVRKSEWILLEFSKLMKDKMEKQLFLSVNRTFWIRAW